MKSEMLNLNWKQFPGPITIQDCFFGFGYLQYAHGTFGERLKYFSSDTIFERLQYLQSKLCCIS